MHFLPQMFITFDTLYTRAMIGLSSSGSVKELVLSRVDSTDYQRTSTQGPSRPSVFFKDPGAVFSTFFSITVSIVSSTGTPLSHSAVALANSTGVPGLSRATVPILASPWSARDVAVIRPFQLSQAGSCAHFYQSGYLCHLWFWTIQVHLWDLQCQPRPRLLQLGTSMRRPPALLCLQSQRQRFWP